MVDLNLKFILTDEHQNCYHIETCQSICSANQLTGFYLMTILAFNELSSCITIVIMR